MKVLGLVEGATTAKGGIGLVGVPLIHRAIAERGHWDGLFVAGPPMATVNPQWMVADLDPQRDGGGKPMVLCANAVTRWGLTLQARKLPATVRAVDFVTLHSVYSFPVFLGSALATRYGKPYGLWPHGVFAPVQRGISRWKKSPYNVAVANRILRRASVLFYSAEGEREEARALGMRAPSVVIPHGIDTEEFSVLPEPSGFRTAFLQGRTGPTVLYLGRLNPKKGLRPTVGAFAQVLRDHRDALLVIAGSPDPASYEEKVRRWIEEYGVGSQVVLTGRLSNVDRLAAFAAARVFVLLSEAENFGFALFEALAAGLPVVISKTLNYASAVAKAGAGFVVDASPEAAGPAIARILANPELGQQMGAAGRRLAADFSWQACGARIEHVVGAIVHGDRLPADVSPEYP